MPVRWWRFAIASLLILALALSHVCGSENQTIRVGLTRTYRGVKQITVLASSNYAIFRTGSVEKLVKCTNLEPVTIDASDTKITLRRTDGSVVNLGTSVVVAPNDPIGTISIDSPARPSKQYRGTIELTLKSGLLQLVNVIGIEDYLPGVIACEMPSSYPSEALKAQAVAARSYSISERRKHNASGYDLCDDSHCQVYDGTLREKPSCSRAVIATKGQVLTYNGQIASIMYCADCGGVTECCGRSALPYLISVTEPAGVSHRIWEKSYKIEELSAKLVAGGIKEAAGLKNITVTNTSASGRALAISVIGAKASTSVTGAKLRAILGLDAVRSTLFTIDAAADGTITIKGKGYGHGVGLCQVGAKALADAPFGYTFQQILGHYYPGTALTAAPGGSEVRTAREEGPHTGPLLPGEGGNARTNKASAIIDVRVVEPAL